MYSEKRR